MKKSCKVKRLPSGVKEAWFYKGKNASVHIVLFPEIKNIELGAWATLQVTNPSRQIDIYLK